MRAPTRSRDRVQAVSLYQSGKGDKMGPLRSGRHPIVHVREAEDEEEAAPQERIAWWSNSSGSDDEERWDEDEDEDGLEGALDAAEIRRRYTLRRASEVSAVSWGSAGGRSSEGSSPASTSPLPSLSPSRPRLFEDDSDDEDEDQVIILRSPSTPPSLSKSPSLTRRSPHRKPAATDPLLSPAPSSPVLAHGFGARQGCWIPTPSRVEHRRLSTSSPLGDLLPPAGPTTSSPAISLLTQSLRSLARLPNLSVEHTAQPPLPSALEIEGFGEVDEHAWEWKGSRGGAMMDVAAVDEAWEIPRSSEMSGGTPHHSPLLRRLPPSLVDNEHATVVQLQTFSSPAPPSPPRKTIDLPPLAPIPQVVEEVPSPPPVNRYISNPHHLLMISLELSMMRADKIRSPLRQRAILVRCGGAGPLMRSSLQFEVV